MNRRRAQQRREAARQARLTAILLVAVILLAAGLRIWQLGSLPPGLYHDEAYYGLDALALNAGDSFPNYYEGWELYAADAHADRPAVPANYPIFFEGNYGREPLHVYLVALSIQLLGASPFAIRIVPAVAGILSVLTTFLACRALLGWERWDSRRGANAVSAPIPWHNAVSLLAAFTVAILYPAITFSRFGIRAMLFVPFETLAVASFWYGVNAIEKHSALPPHQRSGSRSGWGWLLLSGVLLGAGIYTYAAARLLPLLFMLFVPVWLWLWPAARKAWPGVAIMAAAALLTAAPLLYYFYQYPYFLVFRTGYVANRGLGTYEGRPWLTWLTNVGRVLVGLIWRGETHLRHNLPGRPYLDPIQALLFVLGLAQSVAVMKRPQRFRGLFLLLWLAVMLLPTILSGDAPHFGRMTGAVAPAAILVALGASRLWTLIVAWVDRSGRDGRRLASAVLALGFAFSGVLAAVDYFGRYAHHPDLERDFYLADWQLGQHAASAPADTVLFLSPTQEELATTYFALQGDTRRLADYNGIAGAVPAGIPGRPAQYYLRPGEEGTLRRLQEYFPAGSIADMVGGTTVFRVPADAPRLPDTNPTDVAFGQGNDNAISLLDWTATIDEGSLYLTLYWQATGPIDQPFTAFVHLVNSEGELATQLDRPPAGYPTQDWRVGEIIADQFALPLQSLPAGDYLLKTGFYHSDTQEPLGESVQLGRVTWGGEP